MAKKQAKEPAKIMPAGSSTSLTRKVEQLYPFNYYAPVKLSKALRHVHTPEDVFSCPTDTIGLLCRVEGEEKMEALIALYLANLNELLGLKYPLTAAQCDEIAAEIVCTYRQLTMADVHVIFRRAKTGVYGEFYERISMPKVLTWFREYFEERIQVALEISERQDAIYKNSYIGEDNRSSKSMKIGKVIKKNNLK